MSDLIENWRNNAKKEVAATSKKIAQLKKIDKKQLNVLANKTDKAVFEKVDCLKCANCCKNLPALVNPADISRISKHLNLSKKQFSKKYLKLDEDNDFVTKAKPCPFLQKDNKCEIYEIRPQACSDYPITGNNLFANNMNQHLTNSIYCPAVYYIVEALSLVDFDN